MVHDLKKFAGHLLLFCLLFTLSACQGGIDGIFPKAEKPLPSKLLRKIKDKGMALSSPIVLRIYKTENKLEVWKAKTNGRYALLKDYEICQWSGKLGPKFKEGDRQAPEGFYDVSPGQMNPNSSYHLSFNMGYPNRYDRSHGRTGKHLMVHGACSSAGCYSMTDEYVEEIYGLAREAFKGGQRAMQVQAYPFKMTPKNMAEHVNNPNFEFWKMLKQGSDHFEVAQRPPKVDVCEKRYVFNQVAEEGKFRSNAKCPVMATPTSLALAYNKKQSVDQKAFVALLSRKASSPFVEDTLREAAKKQVSIERLEKARLKEQRAALAVRQQNELLSTRQIKAENAAKIAAEKAESERIALEKASASQVPNGQVIENANNGQNISGQTSGQNIVVIQKPAGETELVTPSIQFAKPIKRPKGSLNSLLK